MIRRIAAFSFLSIYLLGSTEAHQILRLPVFVKHFQDHQIENPDQGLIRFIFDHYISLHDAHDSRHEQLPFKSHDCVASGVASLTPEVVGSPLPQPEYVHQIIHPPVSCCFTNTVYASIWQPPKLS
jgi:hypothetical protein